MCGIVGMSFRYYATYSVVELQHFRETFTELLIRAEGRGRAATGVVVFKKEVGSTQTSKPRAYMVRSVLPAREFVKTAPFENVLRNLDNDTFSILGHTRAATSGTASELRNNHPHRSGAIMGVHNGIVNQASVWNSHPELERKTECDTEAIFALINHRTRDGVAPMSEAVCRAMPDIPGSYALAMVDLRDSSKTYLLRDNHMPLCLAWSLQPKVAIFASQQNWIEELHKKNAAWFQRLEYKTLQPMALYGLDSKGTGDALTMSQTSVSGHSNRSSWLQENQESLSVANGGEQALDRVPPSCGGRNGGLLC